MRIAPLASLALAGLALASGVPARAGPPPPAPLPFSIRAVATVQRGPALVWTMGFASSWTLPAYRRRSLCLIPLQAGSALPHRLYCARRAGGSVVLMRERQERDGTIISAQRVRSAVVVRGTRTLRVTVPLDALGLHPGALLLRTRVLATGDDCAVPPPPAARAAPPPPRCAIHMPQAGWTTLSLRGATASTCRAAGASYRTSGPSGARRVALTFDDGPWSTTSRVLDILRAAGVHGTFFVIGEQVAGRAADLRRALAEGNVIGDHSWNHADLAAGGARATDQLVRTNAAIERATGFRTCLFRAPYGAVGPDLIARARDLGMLTIQWSADPRNWSLPGTDAIVSRLLAQASPGGILLMHDGGGDRSQTVAALPQVIQGLRDRGYQMVTVPELLGLPAPATWPAR